MDKLKVAEEIGKATILKHHDFFAAGNGDDLERITTIKRTIEAIAEYLRSDEGLPKDKIGIVAENLNRLSRNLYVEACCAAKDKDENETEVREESEEFYDYTYKHEEYPY